MEYTRMSKQTCKETNNNEINYRSMQNRRYHKPFYLMTNAIYMRIGAAYKIYTYIYKYIIHIRN